MPPGAPNYATARGLALLLHELAGLEAERAQLSSRVTRARVVDPRLQPRDEVRFGETVSLRSRVDEAAPSTVSSRSSRLSTAEHELISCPEGHRTRSIRSNGARAYGGKSNQSACLRKNVGMSRLSSSSGTVSEIGSARSPFAP